MKFLRIVSAFFLALISVMLMGSYVQQSAYSIVQNSGTPLTRRTTLNCIGGVTCADTGSLTTISTAAIAGNYSQSFTSQTSVVLTHNLGTLNVITACYDTSTPPAQIIPNGTFITDSNDVTVTFSIAQSGYCTVNGLNSGGGGGGSTITSGTFASLPAAGTAGRMYLFTDSAYTYARDNGSTWDLFNQGHKLTAPTGFSWINQSTATLTTTFGGEVIMSAIGTGGSNLNGRSIAYPSPPFTRTLAVLVNPLVVNGSGNPNNGSGGLFISDGTAVEVMCSYGLNSMQVQFGPAFNNITTNLVSFPLYTTLFNNLLFFRFDDGVTVAGQRSFYYSFDGSNFTLFFQESRTANLTPTLIGYYAGAFDTGTQTKTWALGWQ